MTRTNVTLQPSKRIVTMAAAQIYAAYVSAGRTPTDGDAQPWVERAVQDAIAIARQVEATVQSDEELPDDGKQRLRHWPDESEVPNVEPPE